MLQELHSPNSQPLCFIRVLIITNIVLFVWDVIEVWLSHTCASVIYFPWSVLLRTPPLSCWLSKSVYLTFISSLGCKKCKNHDSLYFINQPDRFLVFFEKFLQFLLTKKCSTFHIIVVLRLQSTYTLTSVYITDKEQTVHYVCDNPRSPLVFASIICASKLCIVIKKKLIMILSS